MKTLTELTQEQLLPLLKESDYAFLPSSRHPNQTASQLNQKFLPDPNYKVLGYVINEEVASYVIALSGRQEGEIAIGPMYVGEGFRGRGLGKSQVEAFIGHYANRGYNTVFTKTWENNHASRSIFTSLGFTEVRRVENDRINGDASIEYELNLNATML